MDLIIKEYAKNPLANYVMSDCDISQHEGNFICWDDITVYLKIQDAKVVDFSYDGNCSSITRAAASFLSEYVSNQTLEEVLSWNYQTFVDRWFEVSPRRRRAAVIALLGVKNAIYTYLKKDHRDDFDDLID